MFGSLIQISNSFSKRKIWLLYYTVIDKMASVHAHLLNFYKYLYNYHFCMHCKVDFYNVFLHESYY